MVLHAVGRSGPRLPEYFGRALGVLYGASAIFLVIATSTNWMLHELVRTSWGWQYRFGPAFAAYAVCMTIGSVWALRLTLHGPPGDSSPEEERRRLWLVVPCLIAIATATATDIVVPMLGFHFPVLGSISFALLGLIAAWSVHRYGYFLLSPGNFADEILETLPDGVLLVRSDGSIRVANPGIALLSGRAEAELLEMAWTDLMLPSTTSAAPDSGGDEYELCGASGERIPVLMKSSELRDRQGNTLGMVLAVRDVREVEDLRTRVILSARLAAVGELAAGVAHEINNPIAFVRSNLSQLQAHWKTLCSSLEAGIRELDLAEVAGEGNELIDESIDGVDRAAEIVRGIRNFSHGGAGDRDSVDLNKMIEDVLYMAASQMQSDVTIERHYVELPLVQCAPQELKQVFLNLVVNAGHAVADGGTIRIRTEADGNWVVAHIEDDGDGIPPEIIDRIFDPFFTTRNVGEGTGLGLGIAYQITKSHGGEITLDSPPGGGARFHVRLPLRPPKKEPL
jgi:PAS domain S-box-containing protein